MAKTIKNEVLVRTYIVGSVLLLISIAVFVKTFYISQIEGEQWKEKSLDSYLKEVPIKPDRGNVLSDQGSLLATSLPYFDIAFDPNSTGMSKTLFDNNIDSLAESITSLLGGDKSPGAYRDFLVEKRKSGERYVTILRNATFDQKEKLSQFPIFNQGQYRGGLIVTPQFKRSYPFGVLAQRTIGYVRDSTKVGLEGRYDKVLSGKTGKQIMFRIPQGYYIPVNNLLQVKPEGGKDIITTINVDIQDITTSALANGVRRHKAKWGVAIVMEVKTGAIKAMSNLSLTSHGDYWETYNNAIGTAIEPGSTFKIASMMSLLEDGFINLEDLVDLEQGEASFYEETMRDAVIHGLDTTTVKHAFEISSNVGIAKLVQKYYSTNQNAQSFIKNLKEFRLNQPTGIELDGEAIPYIKAPYDEREDWSGTTLPWMSIGYELSLTPLQLLTFYNTIANDGRAMKPYLVSSIEKYGATIDYIKPTVMARKIAKPSTIKKAQFLLESVVNNGTAKAHQSNRYNFAGKTGTAQINYKKLKDVRSVGGYQASFVGYFPTDKPKYSVLVIVSNPQVGGYYGSQVALPIFKEISDKIFSTKTEVHQAINNSPKPKLAKEQWPKGNVGYKNDLQYVLASLNLEYETQTQAQFAALISTPTDSVKLRRRDIKSQTVPNVIGMTLKDAIFLLENENLKVQVNGYGKVIYQSIKPNTKTRGQTIYLKLR